MLETLAVIAVIVGLHASPVRASSAAAADGYRRLIVFVLQAPTSQGRTLADAIGDDAEAELVLRRAVYAARRTGSARSFSNGDCEVDVSINLVDLREQLEQVATPNEPRALARAVLVRAVSALSGTTLVATGVASPPPKTGRKKRSAPPTGWEDVSAKGIELAQRAAQADCRDQLVKRIAELRFTASKKVKLLLVGSPGLERELAGLLGKVKFADPVYEPIQVCSVKGSVALSDALVALKKLARNRGSAGRLAAADLSRVPALNPVKALRAAGYGVPPIQYVTRRGRPSRGLGPARTPPSWAVKTLRATGRASQPASKKGTAQGKLIAARAAAADARIQLGKQIDKLKLPPDRNRTIREFFVDHPELRRDVAAFMRSVRKVDTRWEPSGDANVVMEVRLKRLWLIVEPYVEASPPGPRRATKPKPAKKNRPKND